MLQNHERTLGWSILMAVLFLIAMMIVIVILGLVQNAAAQTWSRTVNFAWDANSETDLKEYRLYENNQQVATIPAGTETVTRVIMTPGTYTWYLTAVDLSLNESGPSNSVSIPLDNVAPGSPLSISINITITVTP